MNITAESLKDLLNKTIKGIDLTNLNNAESFADLGLDSLDQASFLMAIDEAYGVNIPDSDVEQCYSIDLTLKYLKAHLEL